MSDRADVRDSRPAMVYIYDGSWWGLLCCVYDSYTRKERVVDIFPEEDGRMSLYPTRRVETDESHARRVYNSLEKKIGAEGKSLVTCGFMNSDTDKAYCIFQFIELGYAHGAAVCAMVGDEVVSQLHKLYKSVWNENHLLLGFVRFSEAVLPPTKALTGSNTLAVADENSEIKVLAAVVEPKHDVLQLMAKHFCERYPEERFIIYDKVRSKALVYQPYSAKIIVMENFELPKAAKEEILCRRLWKNYYDTIAIRARENPRCRMTHMAKRFWGNMTEMQEEGD